MTKGSMQITFKGGAGSGHRGHSGRPGKVGGSTTGKRRGHEFTNANGTYHTIPTNWKKKDSRTITRTAKGVTYTIKSYGKGGQQAYILTAKKAQHRSSVLRTLLNKVVKMISSFVD